jgi:hypothetical protein
MKGQLSMEVIVCMVVFIIFVSYLFFQILGIRPFYIQQIKAERIRAEAYQISELLINDPGEPIYWDVIAVGNPDGIKRIGLSDHTYNLTNLISWLKVGNLSSLCSSNYEIVREKIGMKDYQFSIIVNKTDGGVPVLCYPPSQTVRGGFLNFTIERVVGINTGNNIVPGKVIVRVWG